MSTVANKQTRAHGADPLFPRLLGERLCLDFVNSIEGPWSTSPEDFLTEYPALVRWGWHSGMLEKADIEGLLVVAESSPHQARIVFEQGIALRDTISRVFVAIARGGQPDAEDLRELERCYLHAQAQARLQFMDGAYGWVWDGEADALDRLLWPIVRSAIDLLTLGDVSRVKQCPGCNDCGWLFYDTSKNRTRHWCSMEGCGSRAKMRRQYARKRVGRSPETGQEQRSS